MKEVDALRTQLVRLLDSTEAHVSFDGAVEGIPPDSRGVQPEGLPYSPWQLLEHMRLAQRDILEFCVNESYVEHNWPDDYWPSNIAPPTLQAWDASIAQYRSDREALKQLAADPKRDLFATIAAPRGTGQTYLRELLVVADHTAYHVGQLVAVRRLLGVWSAD